MEVTTDLGLTAADTASAASKASLGQQDFLRMLIAQLENQDPLNPQEATEFTAQLAQFSSLEQEIGMRATLEQIAQALNTGDQGTAIDLIGKSVLAESSQFELGADGADLRFVLSGASDSTRLVIRNSAGAIVQELQLDAQDSGINSYRWDGLGSRNNPLPAGVYQLEVQATADLETVPGAPLVQATVTGADLSASDPFLRLGELVVPLSSVREVQQPRVAVTP